MSEFGPQVDLRNDPQFTPVSIAGNGIGVGHMSTWRVLITLFKYRPWYLALNMVVFILFFCAPLVMGIMLQEITDTILGEGRGIWSVNELLAAFGGWGVINLIIIASATWAWFGLELSLCGLMRRNMLEWLMTGPGTRQLPDTTGESLSRLRDDVREAAHYYEMYVDSVGLGVFSVIAIYFIGSHQRPTHRLHPPTHVWRSHRGS